MCTRAQRSRLAPSSTSPADRHTMPTLLSLPSSLLLLLTIATGTTGHNISTDLRTHLEPKVWPYNLAPEQKYWPEHEALVKRNKDVEELLQTQTPVGVRKMSGDPDEMFFLDYWVFEHAQQPEQKRDAAYALRLPQTPTPSNNHDFDNTTLVAEYLPPFLPHSGDEEVPSWTNLRFFARNVFDKREFQCPTGTNACTSINRPNSCCQTGETCMIVPDTGLGDVGCCPSGQTCGGPLAGCQTAQGYSSCPGSSNGGCCIPNYSCMGVGCVATGHTTVLGSSNPVITVTVTPNAVTSTSTSSAASSPATTVIVVTPSPSTITSTQAPPQTHTVYTTLPANTTVVVVPASAPASGQSSLVCAAGFNSCAASLGGGCCSTDRVCGSSNSCLPSSTSSTDSGAGPAVRPTSDTGAVVTTTVTSTSSGFSVCPTGFYMCSAAYIGGCCQVDRECRSISCAPSSSTTVNAQGATIVVPVGVVTGAAPSADAAGATSTITAAASTATAVNNGASRCANGWYGCAANQGGGCCPSGYACGASCSSTSGVGPSQVNKIEPTSAAAHKLVEGMGVYLMGIAMVLGGGMIAL